MLRRLRRRNDPFGGARRIGTRKGRMHETSVRGAYFGDPLLVRGVRRGREQGRRDKECGDREHGEPAQRFHVPARFVRVRLLPA